ncbi:hypothetical protein FCH28_09630 [Streptomyces piniterrae]|uniref:Uncharacterized protein n=1 Tax=Streptomyces piniterrae TaxID=2571125 RepID=A0A4U0NME3_9ACTN|nr:hypothetical protein [Streptomyces piniterrae]TJZ55591.1 hypothetical protein FCH28_09630 [Streptomyces piniterrae]
MSALIAASFTVGYFLGRLRPWDRLDTWLWRRLTFGGRWTCTRRGQLGVLAVHALLRPAATVHAWRHRNDPTTPRSSAVRVVDITTEEN